MRNDEFKIISATTILIILNVLMFLFETLLLGGSTADNFVTQNLTMYTPYVLEGQAWRMFTSMFLHFGAAHIVMNMIALYNIGYFLEGYAGTIKYTIIYLLGGIFGNVAVIIADMITSSPAYGAGASGAIFAVLGAILAVAIKDRNSGLSITNILSSTFFALAPGFFIQGISLSAHIGGLIGGFLLALLLVRRR